MISLPSTQGLLPIQGPAEHFIVNFVGGVILPGHILPGSQVAAAKLVLNGGLVDDIAIKTYLCAHYASALTITEPAEVVYVPPVCMQGVEWWLSPRAHYLWRAERREEEELRRRFSA